MSKTGTYVYVKGEGLVKVSDRVPNVQVFDCFVPDGGYYSDNLETYVESRAHKRQLMAAQGVHEKEDKLTKREI